MRPCEDTVLFYKTDSSHLPCLWKRVYISGEVPNVFLIQKKAWRDTERCHRHRSGLVAQQQRQDQGDGDGRAKAGGCAPGVTAGDRGAVFALLIQKLLVCRGIIHIQVVRQL